MHHCHVTAQLSVLIALKVFVESCVTAALTVEPAVTDV